MLSTKFKRKHLLTQSKFQILDYPSQMLESGAISETGDILRNF